MDSNLYLTPWQSEFGNAIKLRRVDIRHAIKPSGNVLFEVLQGLLGLLITSYYITFPVKKIKPAPRSCDLGSDLGGISFSLPFGARCLCVGRNGAGKSTLLQLLSGQKMAPAGTLEICGEAPRRQVIKR